MGQTDFGGHGSDSTTTEDVGFGGVADDTESSSSSRRQFEQQIHVKGQWGTKTVRRDDDPDIGSGRVELVLDFDGVIDHHDDALMGPLTVGATKADSVVDDFRRRVKGLTVYSLEKDVEPEEYQ